MRIGIKNVGLILIWGALLGLLAEWLPERIIRSGFLAMGIVAGGLYLKMYLVEKRCKAPSDKDNSDYSEVEG